MVAAVTDRNTELPNTLTTLATTETLKQGKSSRVYGIRCVTAVAEFCVCARARLCRERGTETLTEYDPS
jgi:hypothetical protein